MLYDGTGVNVRGSIAQEGYNLSKNVFSMAREYTVLHPSISFGYA